MANAKLAAEQFTCFFGRASPFSQHHPCEFEINGTVYNCAEQYMMHRKAVEFKDEKMAAQILKTSDPVEQKRCGRQVKGFDPVVWNKTCEKIVEQANREKFSQNTKLKEELLKTEGTTLVEASPRDRKWGIGLGKTNPKALDRAAWRGQNLLGNILTMIRDELLAKKSAESVDNDRDELLAKKPAESVDNDRNELLAKKSAESVDNADATEAAVKVDGTVE